MKPLLVLAGLLASAFVISALNKPAPRPYNTGPLSNYLGMSKMAQDRFFDDPAQPVPNPNLQGYLESQ